MTQKELRLLLKKLPHRKNAILAKRIRTVSQSQVRCVFRGELTDPQIVALVIAEARKLAKECARLPQFKKARRTKEAA